MTRDRRIPDDSPLRELQPAPFTGEGCNEWSTTKHGLTKNICTLPKDHPGVHVHHAFWGHAREFSNNPAKRYWVRNDA